MAERRAERGRGLVPAEPAGGQQAPGDTCPRRSQHWENGPRKTGQRPSASSGPWSIPPPLGEHGVTLTWRDCSGHTGTGWPPSAALSLGAELWAGGVQRWRDRPACWRCAACHQSGAPAFSGPAWCLVPLPEAGARGSTSEVRQHRQLLQGCRRLSSRPRPPCLPTARAALGVPSWGALPRTLRNRSLQGEPRGLGQTAPWLELHCFSLPPGWWPLSEPPFFAKRDPHVLPVRCRGA